MHGKIQLLIGMILSILIIAACFPLSSAEQNDQILISVSVLPQKYFIERIGGDRIAVNVMVGPGDSPHTYEPKAKQMTALSKSLIYFRIGVEFEDAWMGRIASANPDMRIVDLTQGIDKIPLAEHYHKGEGLDPHVWTSPELVSQMAEQIHQEISTIDPENSAIYRANLDELLFDISDLQLDIQASLSEVETRKFMVFHPAWGYFAQEYGLEQIPIEIGGSEPNPGELVKIIEEAKNEGIRVIFAQPEFSTQTAEYLASEIDGEVVLITPLAEDWLRNMREVASTFESIL